MKILFIMYDNQSSRNHVPVGPCYVAGYLKHHGYDDITYYSQDVYHYPEEHLTEYLNHNHFDVIGIGFAAGYYQLKKINLICEAINKSTDRPFVALGGHGPSPEPDFFITKMKVDAVIMGEGELAFLNLVKALDANTPLKNVKGIAFLKDDGNIKVNERAELIMDLDSIPFPLYELLPIEYYLNAKLYGMKPTERFIYMITSRGCNYHCNFCYRLDQGIRLRSAENVVEEIIKYKKMYNISFIHFVDELWMYSKARAIELAEAFIKANLNINYFCTGRLNIVDREIVKIMKRSGCKFIDYGIEQFDNFALKAMNKCLTEEQIINGIEITKAEDVGIAFNIIFGNIGDTPKSLKKSIDFLNKYNDYGQLRVIRPVTPYPGSPLYDYAIEKGYLKNVEDFYKKHKNLELLTVNFTQISDEKFYQLMFEANKEIIMNYYKFMQDNTIDTFKKVYFNKQFDFRGARH